ncbi:MAG: hypothetical protein Q8N44_10745 [Rubrivivax sp.]|nr:hypothetical protein [Rubrivivax sp.]
MSPYLIQIVCDSLAAFQARIRAAEADGAAFTGNRVGSLDGQRINLAAFAPQAAPPGSPDFTEIGSGTAAAAPVWSGVVLVGNRDLAVSMSRATSGEPT